MSVPITAICDACGATYGDKDVINAAIDQLARKYRIHIDSQCVDYYKCCPPYNTTDEPIQTKINLSFVIHEVQIHFWNHSRSCFKVIAVLQIYIF